MNQNKISLAKKTLQYLEKKKLRDINLKNFLSNNQDKLENFNSKNKLLIVDRGRLHQIFHASIFALAFNKKKKII